MPAMHNKRLLPNHTCSLLTDIISCITYVYYFESQPRIRLNTHIVQHTQLISSIQLADVSVRLLLSVLLQQISFSVDDVSSSCYEWLFVWSVLRAQKGNYLFVVKITISNCRFLMNFSHFFVVYEWKKDIISLIEVDYFYSFNIF